MTSEPDGAAVVRDTAITDDIAMESDGAAVVSDTAILDIEPVGVSVILPYPSPLALGPCAAGCRRRSRHGLRGEGLARLESSFRRLHAGSRPYSAPFPRARRPLFSAIQRQRIIPSAPKRAHTHIFTKNHVYLRYSLVLPLFAQARKGDW